jgi:hypothetical protein
MEVGPRRQAGAYFFVCRGRSDRGAGIGRFPGCCRGGRSMVVLLAAVGIHRPRFTGRGCCQRRVWNSRAAAEPSSIAVEHSANCRTQCRHRSGRPHRPRFELHPGPASIPSGAGRLMVIKAAMSSMEITTRRLCLDQHAPRPAPQDLTLEIHTTAARPRSRQETSHGLRTCGRVDGRRFPRRHGGAGDVDEAGSGTWTGASEGRSHGWG